MTDRTPRSRPPRALLAVGAAAGTVAVVAGLLATSGNEDGADAITLGDGAETSLPTVDVAEIDPDGPLGFELRTLPADGGVGSAVRLADYVGTPLVVNFFSSWCPPCIAEMPEIEEAHRELGGKVRIVGVNHADSRAEGLGVVASTGVTYDLVEDPSGELHALFEAFSMPATVFIDADGNIVAIRNGRIDKAELIERATALL